MTSENKTKAEKLLKKLQTDDQTNLWDGLYTSLEILRTENSETPHLKSIFLLTDGQPNIIPPNGHITTLKRYLEKFSLFCTVNTFGFGYHLDDSLLYNIAMETNGMYSYIPDVSIVGTAFVNAVSNLMVTMATNVKLEVTLGHGVAIESNSIIGSYPCDFNEGKVIVTMGTLQYEQCKNIIICMKIPREFSHMFGMVTATLKFWTPEKGNQSVTMVTNGDIWNQNNEEIEIQTLRLELIDLIYKVAIDTIKTPENAQTSIKSMIKTIEINEFLSDKRVNGVLKDLKGQVTKATNRPDWYKRWGIHYLPSLARFHQLQICGNFKDFGLQYYGGKMFHEIREKADDIFIKLLPPKPSAKLASPPVTSMKVYHSSGNICFHGDGMVATDNNTLKIVREVV